MSGLWPFNIPVDQPWGFTSPASKNKDRSPGSPLRPMLVYAAPLALFRSATNTKGKPWIRMPVLFLSR
jgi:hypothetical protein